MKFRHYLQCSLLKTILFNFRYLPFRQAVRLPVLLFRRTIVSRMKGRIHIAGKIRHGMIKLGRCGVTGYERHATVLNIQGDITFCGKAVIGSGSSVAVSKTGKLVFGENFHVTGGSRIFCEKEITFGRDVLISWECLFLDSDQHRICAGNGERLNEARPVAVGNHVWIGCRNTILKGVVIPDGCVVAANSTLTHVFAETASIIGGSGKEQRILKTGITWES